MTTLRPHPPPPPSDPSGSERSDASGGGGGWGRRVVVLMLMAAPALAEIDPQTGLVIDTGFEQVRAQCMACHSTRLVAQNRSTRDGWQQMIRWMQETQGLWPLGDAEPVILDYLAKNYGPIESGRRRPLEVTFDE